jgi:hypothetical protein
MTTTLNKLLIAAALSCFAVTACDRPQGTRMAEEQPGEFAESGNTRCALVNEQVFCASSRMREPIRQASFAAF